MLRDPATQKILLSLELFTWPTLLRKPIQSLVWPVLVNKHHRQTHQLRLPALLPCHRKRRHPRSSKVKTGKTNCRNNLGAVCVPYAHSRTTYGAGHNDQFRVCQSMALRHTQGVIDERFSSSFRSHYIFIFFVFVMISRALF